MGMAGPIKGRNGKYAVETHEKHGKAMMSATFGEINPWTLDKKPCFYNTLAKQSTKKAYELASDKYPLDQLPHDASVLVHCGPGYYNAGTRSSAPSWSKAFFKSSFHKNANGIPVQINK